MVRALSEDWRSWLRLNLGRGCDPGDLFWRASQQGFDPTEISRELAGYRPPPESANSSSPGHDNGLPHDRLYHAPLTDPTFRPRAWRLDTNEAQVYEIPDLLSEAECAEMVRIIDSSLIRSTVTRGPADYRTSRTCHMRSADPEVMLDIDRRLSRLIGCDPAYSEPIQGQRYDVGEYFKEHTDWFSPGTEEAEFHTRTGGQRTWTVMVYLNHVPRGGSTRFERVGRDFHPVPGLAVAWNNLTIDGSPNPNTLHEALPVEEGSKYVITKWFRERPGRNL